VRAVGTGDAGMDLESSGDEAVIDVGAHVTNICVHARQIVRFVRILPSGGRDITLAIARGLGIEDDTAEQLKRGEETQGLDVVEARRLAISRAGSFVDEIRSSLEFYTAQAQAARIGRVLITGGGSKLEGLLELLRERIPVSVERGQVFLRVKSQLDLLPEALAEAEPVLAAAVGLGIPGRVA
jgi:type IV pilus assembly protein PilM